VRKAREGFPERGRKLMAIAAPRRVRFHDLRHTTASLLLNAGVDPFAVQRILRHTDPRITTEVYGHLVPGYLRDALNKLPLPLAGAADLRPQRLTPRNTLRLVRRWSAKSLSQKQRPDPLRKTSARSGLLIGCGGRI